MSSLLEPLTDAQAKLIALVAEAFALDQEWPYFSYLERTFDQSGVDAWELLYSFPRAGWHGYSALWWVGQSNLNVRPPAESEIELTVTGLALSGIFDSEVGQFFSLLEKAVRLYRQPGAVPRREVRDMTVTRSDIPLEPVVLKVVAREPALGYRTPSFTGDDAWSLDVPRTVLDYEGVANVASYVERVETLHAVPAPPPAEAVPSPLELPAALDYLDAIWRRHVEPEIGLFTFPSAERAAKLSYPVGTPEEFDSRLSALGEILRSSKHAAKTVAGRRLNTPSFDEPLAPLKDYLVERVPESEAQVRDAITMLEHVVAIRDAAQHTEASHRGVRGLLALGLDHPVPDHAHAWMVVQNRTVRALETLREALSTASSG